MKKFYLQLAFCVLAMNSWAQFTLIDPTTQGGFESGTTFTANGWTDVGPAANNNRRWYVGTGQPGYTGSRAAFIGNTTTTVGTNTSVRTVHFYRSVTIPAGATNISLSFKYKQATADYSGGTYYDYVRVYLNGTAPVNGTAPAAASSVFGPFPQVGVPQFTTQTVAIPNSYATGTATNLIFTFVSDNVTPHGYGAVDDISLTYDLAIATDLKAIALISPTGTGCYSSSQAATVRIENHGTSPLDFSATNATVTVNVTGAATQTLSLTLTDNSLNGGAPLAPGATLNVPVGNVNMNAAGTYTFAVSTSISGDGNTANNALAPITLTNPIGVTAGSSSSLVCSGSTVNLTAASNPYSGIILNENFNGTAPGWQMINNTTGGSNPAATAWTFEPNAYVYDPIIYPDPYISNDASQFVLTNSDAGGTSNNTNTILQSPAFSTVGYTTCSLNFWHYYEDYNASDFAYVEVSTNGGTNWTTLQTYTTTQGAYSAFVQATINLNAYINQPSVMVRFRYIGVYAIWWAIDNVTISGNASYTYNWTSSPAGFTSTSQNPTGVTVNSPTVYTVTATAVNGCTVTGTATVNLQPAMVLSTAVTDVGCAGNDGAINLTATGTPNFSFNWSNSATTEDISGITPGTYTVTVTDGNTCTKSTTATVGIQPGLLDISSVNVTNVSCNGGNNGAIDITTAGGAPAFTFSWSNSASTEDISGITAGTYSVQVTDNNGCTVTRSVNVTEPTAISLSTNVTNVTCNGLSNGSIDLTTGGGAGSYTYNWSNSTTAQDPDSLAAATYTVTVTDANNCTMTTSATVTEPAALTASSLVTGISCNGLTDGSIDLTPGGGTGSYTYSWSNSATSQDISALDNATYTVTITDANGCTLTHTATVSEPTALTSSATSTNVLCFGQNNGTAIATGNGGTPNYTYNWSSGGSSATETGLTEGTYTVVVTDGNGCTTTSSVTITQPFLLTAIITSSTDILCNGGSNGSATVSAGFGTPGYTYSWSPSGGTSATANNLDDGTYTVTVTDNNGCTANSSVTITEPAPLAVATLSVISEIHGQDGSADINPSGGTIPYTYSWSNGAQTEDLTSVVAGTYTVTVTDANGCTETLSVTIGSELGIPVTGENGSVNIYPNPSDGNFTISVNGFAGGDMKIEVMDMSGKVIRAELAGNAPESFIRPMSLQGLPAGTYFVKLTSDKSSSVHRIVIARQ